MNQKIGGRSKIDVAKEVFRNTVADMPATSRLGLMLYGHRRARDCRDIEIVSKLGQQNPRDLADRVDRLQARGETPIATALLQSLSVFAEHKGEPNTVVLITDGREECQGDPCAAASALASAGLDVKVDVVGFRLSPEERQAVQCISRNSGGRYFDAQDAPALKSALGEVRQTIAQASPPAPARPADPPPDNLLAPAAGGRVIAAPSADWTKIVTGNEGDYVYTHDLAAEVVFGFKDGRPATFSTFSVLIGSANPRWVKDFELLAADDPSGPYRSLGLFATQNVLMIESPYQEFAFPPTTAKYLKFKPLSTHGDTPLYVPQLRLTGPSG